MLMTPQHHKYLLQIKAVAFAGLSSQNPGAITIADAVFGSNPQINPSVLPAAFQLDPRIVMDLQVKFKKP
ncbi:putative germin-like protein subfamily 1 member 9 [Cardamine amara subsp. amara]|uniref:Germin-like protein subfamily 1 member 9 n=1 Tax=Cardamine amara subsp. amara TaxID=228776 RepID=A0ABD1BHY6_CARAN